MITTFRFSSRFIWWWCCETALSGSGVTAIAFLSYIDNLDAANKIFTSTHVFCTNIFIFLPDCANRTFVSKLIFALTNFVYTLFIAAAVIAFFLNDSTFFANKVVITDINIDNLALFSLTVISALGDLTLVAAPKVSVISLASISVVSAFARAVGKRIGLKLVTKTGILQAFFNIDVGLTRSDFKVLKWWWEKTIAFFWLDAGSRVS